jgi:exopolysaccharide biosynthesis polyprenyl glycosylphosphotransferase
VGRIRSTTPAVTDADRFRALHDTEMRDLGSDESRTLAPADVRGYHLRRWLIVSDGIALCAAICLSGALFAVTGEGFGSANPAVALALVPLWIPLGLASGIYHVRAQRSGSGTLDEIGAVIQTAAIWSWIYLLAVIAFRGANLEVLEPVVLAGLVFLVVLACRAATRAVALTRPWFEQETVLVGSPAETARLLSQINRHAEWGIRVQDCFDLGEVDEMFSVVMGEDRARVIFASSPQAVEEHSYVARALVELGVQVDFVAGDYDVMRGSAHLAVLESTPILSLPPNRPARSWLIVKRGVDLAISVPALLILSPLLAFSAIRIKLDSKGTTFYRQARAGYRGRPFQMLKLRTMYEGADAARGELAGELIHGQGIGEGIFKVEHDPRVTRPGGFLRRWSIDEIPQLWNVAKGEMSIVGPRPLPLEEDYRVTDYWSARRMMKPGITGPWQVMGRSDIPFEDMLRIDYTYVVDWSIAEDLKLIVRTLGAVIGGRGAY